VLTVFKFFYDMRIMLTKTYELNVTRYLKVINVQTEVFNEITIELAVKSLFSTRFTLTLINWMTKSYVILISIHIQISLIVSSC
jgi:hypothetical protein